MIVIGIDPGKKGGIAVIDGKGQESLVWPMPLAGKEIDWTRVADLLEWNGPKFAYVEKVHAMPGQGVTSMFSFGKNFGGLLGVLGALEIPLTLVTPQAWKKKVLAGTSKDKDAAVDFCRRRYPQVNLLATERSRVPHDGMADALCIATYGWMMETGR
jgi:crossover junction endodeoxyribonuclease RuvC